MGRERDVEGSLQHAPSRGEGVDAGVAEEALSRHVSIIANDYVENSNTLVVDCCWVDTWVSQHDLDGPRPVGFGAQVERRVALGVTHCDVDSWVSQ